MLISSYGNVIDNRFSPFKDRESRNESMLISPHKNPKQFRKFNSSVNTNFSQTITTQPQKAPYQTEHFLTPQKFQLRAKSYSIHAQPKKYFPSAMKFSALKPPQYKLSNHRPKNYTRVKKPFKSIHLPEIDK